MIDRKTNIPLSIVVAMSKNNAIGVDGDLPWRLSDDLKWFKEVTSGKPIIMGRKTYQSIGKALPNRDNIVLTTSPDFQAKNVTVANSLEDAISIGEAFALAREANEICIIGGGEIYAATLPLVSRIYLTRVDADINGDTFFPELADDEWSVERVKTIEQNDKNQYSASVEIISRKA